MEECVFSGDDESQLTSVAFTPRSGEFELADDFVVLEGEPGGAFRPKAASFDVAAYFFSRLLLVVYFFSFIAAAAQARGLFGSAGLAPANGAMPPAGGSFYEAIAAFPSLFIALPVSNFTLVLLPAFGAALAALMLLTGLACGYSFALLWVLKLSCVALCATMPKSTGDLLLLEVGFLGIFIFPPERFFSLGGPAAPPAVRWALRICAYRVVALSGMYKLFALRRVGILEILGSVPLPTFVNYYLAAIAARYAPVRATLTGGLLFFEVVLSIFVVTPHRSCRLFGGAALAAYALLFSALGNFGPFFPLLLGCAAFCLDDQCLGGLARWRWNALARADEIVRKASVDAIDGVFAPEGADGAPQEHEGADDVPEAVDASECPYGAPSTPWARVLSISPPVGGLATPTSRAETQSPAKYVFLAHAGLWAALGAVFLLSLLLFVTRRFRGLAALAVFVAALCLQHQAEAAGELAVVGQYALFALQAALVAEMLKNGPHTWSFLLWVAIVQLGLVMARRAGNLPQLLGQLVQAFVVLHVAIYGVRIVWGAATEVTRPLAATGWRAAPGAAAPVNNFFTATNYRSVWPVGPDRVELVVMGTDENPTARTRWREYGFKRRPSRLGKLPALLPLYQWHLDEAMVTTFNDGYWVQQTASGALTPAGGQQGRNDPPRLRWGDAYLIALLRRLLTASPDVLGLLAHDPFGGRPARFVRVLAYRYQFDFADGPTGARDKHWYRRELLGELVPPLSYAPAGGRTASGAGKAPPAAAAAAAAGAARRGTNDTNVGQHPSEGSPGEPGSHNVLHIVHTMPAARQRTMALDLADSLNSKVPHVDGVLVTK